MLPACAVREKIPRTSQNPPTGARGSQSLLRPALRSHLVTQVPATSSPAITEAMWGGHSLRLRSVENPHFSRKGRARNGAPGIFISFDGLQAHGHSGQALYAKTCPPNAGSIVTAKENMSGFLNRRSTIYFAATADATSAKENASETFAYSCPSTST